MTPASTVIFGGGGFVGQWLARTLLKEGHRVWLAGLGESRNGPVILTPDEWRSVTWVNCDVRSDADLEGVLSAAKPGLIYHLAGISFVPAAERDPGAAYETNVVGGVRVVTAAVRARQAGLADPTVVVVGSGVQYGLHDPASMPLPETAEQRPATVYAATKSAQEIAVLQVARSTGLRVICTRSFNHSGFGQESSFLLPALAGRIRRLDPADPVLRIGNDVVRDYLHVSDVVSAYVALGQRGEPGKAYNVCSGAGIGVRALAELVLERAGVHGRVELDRSLERPGEIPALVGSPQKLMKATGWAPRASLGQMVDDVLAASA